MQDIQNSFSGYLAYIITKFFNLSKPLSFFLDKLEELTLNKDLRKLAIDKPIYIVGLVRAGTTIILEMLSKHPELASHQYKHIIMPYLPYWLQHLTKNVKIFNKPIERIHRDGILITRDSPEAVEEVFWQLYFNDVHNENTSNIINRTFSNPKFERFYKNHIKKLLISQNRIRYLAKNNYNITRLEYIHRLFPKLKILLVIRNPVDHIASIIKQTKLFKKLERKNPFLQDWMKIVGHYEFGYHPVCINVDNIELIHKIHKLWKNKETYVEGWAHYWASIYNFIANQLSLNKKLNKRILIVNYDDLCRSPEKMIDKILSHTELAQDKFKKVKKYYTQHLHRPTYYTPDFTDQELARISYITKSTAARFGINISY